MTISETRSIVTEDQAQFARSKGFTPACEWGWSTPDCWVSESGCVRVYPSNKFGEITWVAAIYYTADDKVPFKHHEYRWFKEAVAIYA